MYRFKQVMGLVLAVTLLMSSKTLAVEVLTTRAAGLRDMAGHWAEATVLAAVQAGLVNGHPDGSYRPDEAVTRSQFIKLMVQAGGLTLQPGTGGFPGLPFDYGEHPDLQPDRLLTRPEAAIFAVRAMNRLGAALTLHGAPLPYKDEVADWTTGYLAAAHSTGIMKGYPDQTFGAGKSLSRAEAAAITLRVLAASKAREVPVWEANSWEVATLPTEARQVTASSDGTLYWLQAGGQAWRQPPGGEPVELTTLENFQPGPIAAGADGLYLAQGAHILHVTHDGPVKTLAGGPEQGYRNGDAAQAL